MNRLPIFWVNVPDDEDMEDTDRHIHVRLREEWVSVDSDQLILPVSLLGRDGDDLEHSQPGILKQYGGEGLLNDMLLDEQELEKGSEWIIGHHEERGRYVHSVPTE